VAAAQGLGAGEGRHHARGARDEVHEHEELRELLLGTQNRQLVEHTHKDSYWADGGDGSGRNMLGKLLMSVRDELRQYGPSAKKNAPARAARDEGVPATRAVVE
jgi:hypothetical protein